MKSCKNIFHNILAAKNFKLFFENEKVISEVFSAYRSKVSLFSVVNGILQIAVSDVRLISHFFLIKSDISQKLREKLFSLPFYDIRFFFKKKSNIIHVVERNEIRVKEKIIKSEEKLKSYIKTICNKEDLHDLLYRLYVCSVKDKQKYE
jgi:hypothetical protein